MIFEEDLTTIKPTNMPQTQKDVMSNKDNIKPQPRENADGGTGSDFRKLYKLEDQLGSGAFAVVHRVIQRSTGKEFAAKIIAIKKITPHQIAKLDREIRICRKLTHPNIVQLHFTFRDTQNQFLVFDLVVGGELFHEIVTRKRYSELDAAECVHYIYSAVEYCHKNNILHRDLKPENLLLTSKGPDAEIKLADFGLSVEIYDQDEPKNYGFAGSLSYMAPEVLAEESYSFPADMWSCGVILYVLLAGRLPFYDRNEVRLSKIIRSGKFQYRAVDWNATSNEAKHLVDGLLNVNQAARFTASEALDHPWITNRVSIASTSHREPTVELLRAFNARRKLKAAMTVAMVAAGSSNVRRSSQPNEDFQKDLSELDGSFVSMSTPPLESNLPKQRHVILQLTQRLIAVSDTDKKEEFLRLTVPHMTSFSPEVKDQLDQGQVVLEREMKRHGKVKKTTISNPYVHLLGLNAAVIAYKRTTAYEDAEGGAETMESVAETRVWQKLTSGKWVNVHVHRSHM